MVRFSYKKIKFALATAAVLIVALWHVGIASAATLSFVPTISKVLAGNIVSVRVVMGTGGKSANNAEGTIQFPPELLEVQSISKSSSLFSLWVEEPKYSNYEGSITFNGGVPNPGYVGENGEVFTVIFRARKAGTASLVFSNPAVRENDGLGTNILTNAPGATVTIAANEEAPVLPPPVADGTPAAPVVTSPTHPQPGKWYSAADVELRWTVTSGVNAVATLMGHNPTTVPSLIYDPPIGHKKVADVEDGVWYFHVRFRNDKGWGAITHFKVQIDTVPPSPFKVTFAPNPHDDPTPIAVFNATDSLSGIDHYEVKIDNGAYSKAVPDNTVQHGYVLGELEPGDHSLLVKAIDLAGNETIQSAQFTVTSINPPQITHYPSEITEDDLLKVEGTSYPQSSVEVVVEDANGRIQNQSATTLSNGSFAVTWAKNLNRGAYTLKARAIDSRGAKSVYTKPVTIVVKRSALSSTGLFVLNWLSLIFIILLALGGLVLMMLYFVYKIKKMRQSVDKKVHSAEHSMHHAFNSLRENVADQLKILEKARNKRELTKEEEKIRKTLQQNLDRSEAFLEKQLSEIEDSI